MVNNWFARLSAAILPARCLLCGMDATATGFCAACTGDLPQIDHPCPLCALPLPNIDALACGGCLNAPPPWRRCVSALLYAAPADRLVAGLKFRGQLAIARSLAQLLAHQIGDASHIDLILPVPLHWRRRWQRGFNQADVVASELARTFAIATRPRTLRRRLATSAQQTLTAAQRKRNLRNAFVLTADVAGQRIALVDDVVTTGSTASEIARLLLAAGAASVEVWCLARTPR
jgi:ComF family protein